MDDYKFYIKKIFPLLTNNLMNKLLIDKDSLKYITTKDISIIISKIIVNHVIKIGINLIKTRILDYTAGVGGNVISFNNYFNDIIAIEILNIRYNYLVNNLNIYCCNNVLPINYCSIKFNETYMISYNPDVIFIDPPWGDSWVKNSIGHRIFFGDDTIENFILNIQSKFDNNFTTNKLIVLKLPKNYDLVYLYNTIFVNLNNYNIDMFLYILNKMIIIVIEYNIKKIDNL